MIKHKINTIAYLRLLAIDQDVEKDKADILYLANDHELGKVQFSEERVSGKIPWRRCKIATILNDLTKNDTIIVVELSRLGRNPLECLEIMSVALEKGINIYAVKNNWQLANEKQLPILASAFSMAREIGRDFVSRRTKEAARTKRASGVRLGRPPGPGKSKLDKYREEIEALLANGSTKKFVANRYGAQSCTLFNWLKKNGLYPPPVDNQDDATHVKTNSS